MHIRSVKLVLALLLVVCVCSALPAWAQSTDTGTVAGTVTDPTNAVVVGASVTLTDTSTSTSRTIPTNADGRYLFVNVKPGRYDLTFVKPGFSTAKAIGQEVKVGLSATVNITLQVGGGTIEVQVNAVGNELQTMNATVGNTVTAASLDAMPSINRDVSSFVELQPGVSPDGSVAGAVVDQSTFMLDGGNNTNDMDGSMSVYTTSFAGDPTGGISNQSNAVAAGPTGVMPTPTDSVEEFKVNSAGQTADFNSSSGAQVQVVTRRGTNVWHGSVYEYYLDNNFSANTWENNFTGTKLPDWHRSRFGARAGGTILPKLLGGKTYFFANYEGYRWPNSGTTERIVPSADMRLGLLTFTDSVSNVTTTYNLNNTAVTSAEGVLVPANNGCSGFPTGVCDPRMLGINPMVQQMWTKYMPLSNESGCGLSRCDGVNIQGFKANIALPQTSNFGVARLDHDFGEKWHFMSSYRYFRLAVATTDQIDIGGFFPGDTLGVPASLTKAPQVPWYFVAGLNTNISSNTTNDIHYSYLRNWWAWDRPGDPVQFSGLGGALEPLGENHYQVLAPYNVNTQQSRTRFWDGHDQMLRDDVSMLRGNHLFQFGGTYQHNFNWHQRTDNGGGINYEAVYQLATASSAGIALGDYLPANVSSKDWGRDYASTLGIVSIAQIAYTRSGPNLTLNPQPRTPASDKSTIPYYNFYFSDTWHMKPSFTLTYGMGWTLEMPPKEANGKQIELVDQANQLIDIQAYLHSREQAALQGGVYNPIVGFTLVGNSENGRKYPYDPFYGSFSPRIAVAWNPKASGGFLGSLLGNGDTVVRGGYGRIYGRLNGVDLVLVPLLGTGLIQPVQCFGPLMDGATCAGAGGSTPGTAFRIQTDGLTAPLPSVANGLITQTLPQPLYPGINGLAAGAGESLDPHFRPNVVDSFDLTIQRQLRKGMTVELGYIGRRITHEYTPINMNAVPYMMTLGGQRFDKAYAAMEVASSVGSNIPCSVTVPKGQTCHGVGGIFTIPGLAPQPFFEAAMNKTNYGGVSGKSFCAGYTSCTAAVVDYDTDQGAGALSYQGVWDFWSELDNGPFNFARTMMNTPIPGSPNGGSGNLTSGVAVNASVGYGNYNAGFVSFKMSDWHGLAAQSNFTWSKTLSTGSVTQSTSEDTPADPYDLKRGYGLAGFDRKFVYNMFFVYQPPFYKGQEGVLGHVLGGWTFAPIFTAGSGLPMTLGTVNGGGQAFGEGDSVNFFANGNSENAIPIGPIPSVSAHRNVPGSGGVGTSGYGLNLWADPAAVFANIRQPILGLDQRDGGWGLIRGLKYWNIDFSVKKHFKITERVNFEFSTVIANVLNHAQMLDPGGDYLDTSSPGSFGTLPGQTNGGVAVSPRQMEFGLRINF